MPRLDAEAIRDGLQEMPGWAVSDGQLKKTFKVRSFAHAILFLGAVGQLAEAANHHPDLSLHGYNQVTILLSTHSQGGITEKDLALAGAIERLPHKALANSG